MRLVKCRIIQNDAISIDKKSGKISVDRNGNFSMLTFQFNPTSIPYGRGANYSTIESPGMSYPLTQYVGGQVREFTFEVFYYDNPFTGKILNAKKYLESLLPPEKNTKEFTKPPSFTFTYGYFVKKLVLLNLEVHDEWLNEFGLPLMTRFTLTVRQVGR